MEVQISKLLEKHKHPYIYGRYTSSTHYKLFIDGVFKSEIIIGQKFKSVKKFIKFTQEKYGFTDYKVIDMGSYIYQF